MILFFYHFFSIPSVSEGIERGSWKWSWSGDIARKRHETWVLHSHDPWARLGLSITTQCNLVPFSSHDVYYWMIKQELGPSGLHLDRLHRLFIFVSSCPIKSQYRKARHTPSLFISIYTYLFLNKQAHWIVFNIPLRVFHGQMLEAAWSRWPVPAPVRLM